MDHVHSQVGHKRNQAKARGLASAGWTFYAQFERMGAIADLEKAIENMRRALSLASDDDPDKSMYLNDLGSSLESRFGCTGMLSDLDEAITSQRRALSLTPDGHPNKPMYLNNLGISYESLFVCTGRLNDLEEAITSKRQAVFLTPDDHPDKPVYLNNLGNSFQSRFGHTGMLSDLEEAIKIQRQAVSLTPDDDPDKPSCLNNLGITYKSRFLRTGALGDLEEAISNQRQAVFLTPDDHPNKPTFLNSLGSSLTSRFERTGMLSDLSEATKCQCQAISLTPDDHPNKPMYLNNLGRSFESRFGRTGMLSDLEEAVKIQHQAVSLTPDDHPDKPGHLNNLGISYKSQFGRTGILSDLEEAIKIQQQAISLTPDDHPDISMFLDGLGIYFHSRFIHTGLLNDLEDAINSQRQAVTLTPDDDPHKPSYLNNLGVTYESRFGRTGMLSDLEEAIKIQRQSLSLTPNDHPSKSGYFNNLGGSLGSRFGRTGRLSDLEEAIDNQRRAVSLTPDDYLDKPGYLSNLGISLESRFGHTGLLSDLEEAIKIQRRAVSLTPDDHPDKPMYLNSLGISLESRYHHTGMLDDLDEAISNFKSAATFSVGPILLRCRASQWWAQLEATRDPGSALIVYSQAINLLLQVAWIGDPIATRHSQLTDSDLRDLPREAAAFALDVGRPDLALEWLEQGRSVVWNQLLHLQPSVDHLQQAHPDLCAQLTQISHELRNAATRGHSPNKPDDIKDPIALENETQHHHRLAEKWDILVQEIRSLPNFQDFLLPKKVSALMEVANAGPVVVINVHERRCDALVLDQGRDEVLHIPLNKLHYDDLTKMYHLLQQYLADPPRVRRWENRAGRLAPEVSGSLIAGILEQIYSKIIHPILQDLDMTTTRSEHSHLPRIWWCPTGLLTFFLLHAACRTTGTKTDGTFNYVISSYTPTINALLEARSKKDQPFSKLVGIAMADTPGQCSLPGAETEMMKIKKLFAADSRWNFEILRNEQATGEQVLTRMANNSWVHLACHAFQDKQEPTQSGFCLHDRCLTIMDIVAKPFCYTNLAFLSACQTATGDEKASDEAIHLTGAMLGAGYCNVIGTMWAIPDEAASRIAIKVYEVLLSREPDSDRAAQALHAAVREMQESSHDSYAFWVPFVHYGV